ncbi:MAG: Lrp/AsnC family transcriptional regulator [Pseudomonadota bacterium]
MADKANLDEIDRRILKALVADGRITNSQLAEKVGLSSSPCWQRVRRLENEGYIAGYTAILDQKKLDRSETVIIEVNLNRHDDETLASFGEAMARIPEVLEVHLITGGYDFLLKVAVDGTEGYEKFLRERLYMVPGFHQSRSMFSLRCLKRAYSVEP